MDNTNTDAIRKDNIMTLAGKGQVTAEPDIAILRLGVETTGEKLTDIQEENARITQMVLESLHQLGISDIKTFDYTINKIIEYKDGNQIDKGYSVRNILEIRMSNLEQVGTAIDTAVSNGANIVDLIEFDVSDPNTYYLQALNLAIENAFQKANSIAANLGIMNEPVPVTITENVTFAVPLRANPEAAFATPIVSGTKQIEASVTVEFKF